MSNERKPRRFVTPARLYRELQRVVDEHGLQGLDTIDRLLEELVADILADALGDTDD